MSGLKAGNVSSRGFGFLTALMATEEDALAPLPGFDTEEEERSFDEDDTPFPADAGVLEHHVVDDGDIKQGEDGDETSHDGPEEELVAPYVVHPLGEIFRGTGLHAEETEAHVNHLPCEEESEPGEANESGGTGTEDGVAFFRVRSVAASAEIAVAETEHDERECRKAESRHPESIGEDIYDDFPSEDTLFLY